MIMFTIVGVLSDRWRCIMITIIGEFTDRWRCMIMSTIVGVLTDRWRCMIMSTIIGTLTDRWHCVIMSTIVGLVPDSWCCIRSHLSFTGDCWTRLTYMTRRIAWMTALSPCASTFLRAHFTFSHTIVLKNHKTITHQTFDNQNELKSPV